jgi:hypothetical protein
MTINRGSSNKKADFTERFFSSRQSLIQNATDMAGSGNSRTGIDFAAGTLLPLA